MENDDLIWSGVKKERMKELEHFEAIGSKFLNDKGKDRMIFLLKEKVATKFVK